MHLTPIFVHKRLVLPNPLLGRVPSVSEAWNLDADLPEELFLRGLRSVVLEDATRQLHATPLQNRTQSDLSGYCAVTPSQARCHIRKAPCEADACHTCIRKVPRGADACHIRKVPREADACHIRKVTRGADASFWFALWCGTGP